MSIAEALDDAEPTERPFALVLPEEVVPNAAVKGQRWAFDDSIAAMLAPGLILKVEMVLRVEDLHAFGDGRRWRVAILEIGKATI